MPILLPSNENAGDSTWPGSTVEHCIDSSEPPCRTLVTASWLLARTRVYSFRTCSSFPLWPRHRESGRQKKRHESQLSQEYAVPKLEIQEPPATFGGVRVAAAMSLEEMLHVASFDESPFRHPPVRKDR